MKRTMAALLLGNGAYSDGDDLKNPVNDAKDVGKKLKSYGFNTIVATDCSFKEMDKQLKAFRELLKTHDVGLFFFAGHGMQIDGVNYLIAIDTDMESEDDAKHSSLSLNKVIDVMANSPTATKIIILDACRNNPWERAWHRGPAMRGLASVYAPKGTIIGFATSPGQVAYDGAGRNGTYTDALLQHIEAPDCSIEAMFKRVRNSVAAASGGKQTSWEHTSLAGEFYFNLSLGNLIAEYDGTALADKLFVLDETRASHKLIAGLKSHTWPTQNSALAELTSETVKKMGKSSLFVVGRNIYQAACGNANAPGEFIGSFRASTGGYDPGRRKAILDGMLFEIFFDPDGKLRDHIKKKYFDDVFALQEFQDLKSSFDFISDALTVAGGDFYVVPGKGHELSATVSTKVKNKERVVEAIYVDGINVLRVEEDPWDDPDDVTLSSISPDRLRDKLSEDFVIPLRLLKVTYAPAEASAEKKLKIPSGWTVRKGTSKASA